MPLQATASQKLQLHAQTGHAFPHATLIKSSDVRLSIVLVHASFRMRMALALRGVVVLLLNTRAGEMLFVRACAVLARG